MENQFTYTSPENMGLPPGYEFCPSAKLLIEYYLIKKIKGEPIPHNPVKDWDVYGDPKILRKLFEETGTKTLYFYTKLRNRRKRKRVARTTNFGTWDGEHYIRIHDEKKHIGSKRIFSFVGKKGYEDIAGMQMQEYSLDGITQNEPNEDGYVICQINKNPKEERAQPLEEDILIGNGNLIHQNIQDERARPLEEDILIGNFIHQNIQDERAQHLEEDILIGNGNFIHQNIQDERAQPFDEDILIGALENGDWIQQYHWQ